MDKKLVFDTRYFRLFPPEEFLGYTTEKYEAELDRSAFLVVDVYGYGIDSKDPTPSYKEEEHLEGARPTLSWLRSAEHEGRIIHEALYPALQAAREIGMKVIYLNNSAPKIALRQSQFGKMLKRQLNTDMVTMFAEDDVDPREYHYGHSDHLKISEFIAPREDEYFIRKHVYDGFVGTRLDLCLRYLHVKNIFVVGFSNDACMFTTLVDALWHDYKVILLRDATLANNEYSKDDRENLNNTKRMTQLIESMYCVSITSKEFIAETKKAA